MIWTAALHRKYKFADDNKLGGKALRIGNCEVIQRDLDNVSTWSEKWLLKCNKDKCKVMHIGYNEIKQHY